MNVPPRMEPRLAALAKLSVNYDPDALDLAHPPSDWHLDDRHQPLTPETPGDPVPGGTWELARALIRGYEFADPSIVRAFYHSDDPYPGRNMLLELRALGLFKVRVGVRVGDVYDETRSIEDRPVRVFGWAYRTLQGHVERGQMNWEVWKWLDTGEVEFHVHAVSRPARISNPFVRLGFFLLREHEREIFLDSTDRRMVGLTRVGLQSEGRGQRIREASGRLTARRLPIGDQAHSELARQLDA